MLPQCIEAVTKAAGRSLSKAEMDGIEERMLSSMQSIAPRMLYPRPGFGRPLKFFYREVPMEANQ